LSPYVVAAACVKKTGREQRRPASLWYAFADALDAAAEDLDRTAVVLTLDALARRHARKSGASGRRMGKLS
jgi:hypothetical protein